jgi:hypothetical protein
MARAQQRAVGQGLIDKERDRYREEEDAQRDGR